MGKAKDYTGVRYGKAVGIRPTGESNKCKQRVWLWKCDCGEEFESPAAPFVYKNYSAGCRACSKASQVAAIGSRSKSHGMTGSKEHNAWREVKKRVLNKNSHNYEKYSALGMEEDFIDSFEEFLTEIGPYPQDGKRYTVDRIDNNLGYFRNNIRWATNEEQARNKGKQCNNTSGITGVHLQREENGNIVAIAQWTDLDGIRHGRGFSFNKYGEELALLCAQEARDQAIKILNQRGAGYSKNYGL